jgi:hypothetical protein
MKLLKLQLKIKIGIESGFSFVFLKMATKKLSTKKGCRLSSIETCLDFKETGAENEDAEEIRICGSFQSRCQKLGRFLRILQPVPCESTFCKLSERRGWTEAEQLVDELVGVCFQLTEMQDKRLKFTLNLS